jgi:apolipoprotein N-acyltransferase
VASAVLSWLSCFHSGREVGALTVVAPLFAPPQLDTVTVALSRVRAVEHGRSVVVSATSGVSAVIDTRGAIVERTELSPPQLSSPRCH